jgi:hypothetical protein
MECLESESLKLVICKNCVNKSHLEILTDRVAVLGKCRTCGVYASLYCVDVKNNKVEGEVDG